MRLCAGVPEMVQASCQAVDRAALKWIVTGMTLDPGAALTQTVPPGAPNPHTHNQTTILSSASKVKEILYPQLHPVYRNLIQHIITA